MWNVPVLGLGQLDDSRPGINKPVTGSDLRAAIDWPASPAGQSVPAKGPVSAAASSGRWAMLRPMHSRHVSCFILCVFLSSLVAACERMQHVSLTAEDFRFV